MEKTSINIDPELLEKSGLTESEMQELIEIFWLVDLDHGGTISREELAALMKMVGLRVSKDEMDEMMVDIDSNGTGEIDFEEFVLTVTKKVQLSMSQESLLKAFQM